MSKPCPHDFSQDSPQDSRIETIDARQDETPAANRNPANEMSRVLRTAPIHLAADPSGARDCPLASRRVA